MRAILLATVLALAFVCAGAAAAGLVAQSDEFDGTSLSAWMILRGDDFGDGTDHSLELANGVLTIVPKRSWWVDDHEALYVYKQVKGDFVATMRVRVTGTQTELPQANWTLSGIVVRDPASRHGRENWLSLRTGAVNGAWVYERKTTRSSRSELVLDPSTAGWVDLRIARVGARFYLLNRAKTGRWTVYWAYTRGDLPKTLQVGIDGFSGDDSPHADMVDRVDWFHFAPAPKGVTPRTPETTIRRKLVAQP